MVFLAILISQQTAEHTEEWDMHLISYLSLVHEDVGRISPGNVADRIKVLRFLQRLIGTPFFRSIVAPLQDLRGGASFVRMPAEFDIGLLTTIATANGPILGMHIPCDLASCGQQAFPRPLTAGATPLVGSRNLLASVSQADRVFLEERSGATIQAIVDAASAPSGAGVASVVAAPLESCSNRGVHARLDTKMSALVVAAQHLLKPLADDNWESVREGRFSPLIGKVTAFHSEATNSGDPETTRDSKDLLAGLTAGKSVMRCHRELARSKDQHTKLLEYSTAFLEFLPFLKSRNITPPLAMSISHMRIVFHSAVKEHQKFGAGLRAILENGFQDICRRGSGASAASKTPSRLSTVALLRSMVFKAIVDEFHAPQVEDPKLFSEELFSNLQDALQILSDDNYLKDTCQELGDDLLHMQSLVAAAREPCTVRPTAVQEASKSLLLPHMLPIKDALHGTDLGQDILSKFLNHIQVNAKNTVADRKVDRAIEMAKDPRMPQLRPASTADAGGASHDEVDVIMVLDMSCVELMDESLMLISEALQLWTVGQRDEQAGKVVECVTMLMQTALFVDEVVNLLMNTVLRHACQGWLLDDLRAVSAADDSPRLPTKAQLDQLQKVMDDHWLSDDTLAGFPGRVQALVDSMGPCAVQTQILGSPVYDGMSKQIATNVDARASVTSVLESILTCGENFSVDPVAALDEWLAKRTASKTDESFFTRLVMHIQTVKGLQNFSGVERRTDAVHIVCPENSFFKGLVGQWSHAQSLASDLANLPMHEVAKQLLQQSLQVVCDRFAEAIPQEAIRFPVLLGDINTVCVHTLAQTIFIKGAMNDSVQQVGRIFAASGRKEHDWGSTAVLDLLAQLFKAVPKECFRVDLSNFCKCSGAPVVCSDAQETLKAFDLMDKMAKVSMCFAFLDSRFFVEAEALKDSQIKVEAELALSLARRTACAAVRSIDEGQFGDTAKWAPIPFHMPISQAKQFFESAYQVTSVMCRCLLSFAVSACGMMASEVSTHIPVYDHIVSDDNFHEKLARRYLMEWPSRDALGRSSVSLFNALASASRMHTSWNLAPAMQDDEDFASVVAHRSTFDSARKALAIIAGVATVLGPGGKDQSDNAETLIAKNSALLPRSLRDRLTKLTAT